MGTEKHIYLFAAMTSVFVAVYFLLERCDVKTCFHGLTFQIKGTKIIIGLWPFKIKRKNTFKDRCSSKKGIKLNLRIMISQYRFIIYSQFWVCAKIFTFLQFQVLDKCIQMNKICINYDNFARVKNVLTFHP